MIKLGNNDITLKVGSTDVSAAYLGSTLVYSGGTPTPVLPYTQLEWIEMPQTEPYCAVQLVDTYSAATNLYYDFKLLFNNLSDLRILDFANNSHMIGYNNNTIYLDINRSRKFTINGFTTNTEYHFGLGYKNNSYVFENIDSSTTYATFDAPLPKSSKPYFGAINSNGTVNVNGDSERIYSIKVYDSGVLVGDYIPVIRNSDNFVTLYDKITEQYCNTVGGGEMVAPTHSLPDVPFSLNYNAKQYIASAFTIPQTVGQLQNVDAVCNYGYNIVDHSSDGYISITGNTRMILSGNNGTYLNRFNTESGAAMTIISKAVNKVNSNANNSLLTNRRRGTIENINWMWRQYYNKMILHGMTDAAQIPCSSSVPNIIAVRTYYDNGTKIYYNNITQNTSTSPESFEYIGNGIDNGGSMFCDYSDNNDEFWEGDFYWIYMSQTTLTDEQIQQVIDYNENL